jgi:hypothetical protein
VTNPHHKYSFGDGVGPTIRKWPDHSRSHRQHHHRRHHHHQRHHLTGVTITISNVITSTVILSSITTDTKPHTPIPTL